MSLVDRLKAFAQATSADIKALYAGKAAAAHAHPASQISDASAAGRALLTASDKGAQQVLLGAYKPDINPTLDLDFAEQRYRMYSAGALADFALPSKLTFTRASAATYFDALGVMRTAAADVTRIDFDPLTGVCKGLLIEGQGTNVVQHTPTSQTLSSVSAGTATGPNGALANKVVPNAGPVSYPVIGGGNTQSFSNTKSVGETQDYTFFGYFAPHGPKNYIPRLVISVHADNANYLYAIVQFDAFTGVFTGKSYGAGLSEIAPPAAVMMPCGMWRVTWVVRFTQQALLRKSVNFSLQVFNELNQGTYTADGLSGVQYSCMQFEEGSAPSSYIPTTTSAATRAADVASMMGSNFSDWYNPAEGTFVAKFVRNSDSTFPSVLAASDGSSANAIVLGHGSGARPLRLDVPVAGVLQASVVGIGTTASATEYRAAAAYKADNFGIFVNAGVVALDNSGSIPVVNRMNIGVNAAGVSGFLNGHIARLAYYPRRLSSAELQALSSL